MRAAAEAAAQVVKLAGRALDQQQYSEPIAITDELTPSLQAAMLRSAQALLKLH